jgi:hypothetical protein
MKKWIAPNGTQSDGASIPQWALSAVGSGFDESVLDAAVVHDAYCSEFNKAGASYHQASWEDVHAMFYDALIALGTPKLKASLLYAAVYLGGPRWEVNASALPTVLLLVLPAFRRIFAKPNLCSASVGLNPSLN